MPRKVFRFITWGGLGDLALSTPLFAELKRRDAGCKVMVFCGGPSFRREIFMHNPDIDAVRSVSFFANPWEGIRFRLNRASFYNLNYGKFFPSLFGGKRAAYLVAELAGVELEDSRVRLYLSKEEDAAGARLVAGYKNPIGLHITSRGVNKYWDRHRWEAVVRGMPEYSFLQVGGGEEERIEGAVDLRGKTSLREAIAIIRHCKSFAGVDSIFSHVTNAFDVPGVILFGPTEPEVWGHPNNINLQIRTHCTPCIDLLFNSTCPYDRECMRNISSDMVIVALRRQLAGNGGAGSGAGMGSGEGSEWSKAGEAAGGSAGEAVKETLTKTV